MKKIWITGILSCLLLSLASCSDKDDENASLKNELIKRTVSPLLVGEKIEFAYAMGSLTGKLKTARAEASFGGSAGTGFEPYAWHTENGTDVSTVVAKDCLTDGTVSTATLMDVQATTLHYYYVIPPELKGKEVSFVFSATSQANETVTFSTPAYKVSNMDMAKSITLEGTDHGARYFSIEDMKAYTLQEVESGNLSSKIDFVYAYAAKKQSGAHAYDYKHAFFSPAATAYYPDGFTLPASWEKRSTLMEKKLYMWDGQLKDDPNNNIYVDDLDLQQQSFDNSADYVLDLKGEGSVFMKSHDGKYVAYLYINKLDNSKKTAVVGIKRYTY